MHTTPPASTSATDPTWAAYTPMMQQYLQIKAQHPDRIVFYRMGDFYEMFFEDAQLVAEKLHLTLTSRGQVHNQPIPMAGVPANHADAYLAKLLKMGLSVAICEQTQAVSDKKGPMDREVVRILTPGTLVEDEWLDTHRPHRITAIFKTPAAVGIATLDLAQGSVLLSSIPNNPASTAWLHACTRQQPVEMVLPESTDWQPYLTATEQALLVSIPQTHRPLWEFEPLYAQKKLCAQFQMAHLDPLRLETVPGALEAAGALLTYVEAMLKLPLTPITTIRVEQPHDFLYIDTHTRRHLELIHNNQGGTEHTLWSVLATTKTPMGARLLRDWLHHPLRDRDAIASRLDTVHAFQQQAAFLSLHQLLETMGDVPRILSRIGLKTAKPSDLLALEQVFRQLPALAAQLQACRPHPERPLGAWEAAIHAFPEEMDCLENAIVPIPPAHARDGGVFQTGYDATLDRLRQTWGDSNERLAQIEAAEKQRTGIATLKIQSNRIHGYYIEISHAQSSKHGLPADYTRCQTLKNVERYKTPQLIAFERHISHAENEAIQKERELYQALLERLSQSLPALQAMAQAVAMVDVLCAFAERAHTLHWVRPEWGTTPRLQITNGRHPVVEQALSGTFTPNGIDLEAPHRRVLLITGPNMGGKSTYMRQTALIVLMAHMGCFVPADAAVLPLTDRIFTRIGASDDLGAGRSTFMVEMTETAEILRHATPHSLIVVDEIGRGTCPEEGQAIAHAVLEALADQPTGFVLFSTHFFALTQCKPQGAVAHDPSQPVPWQQAHFDAHWEGDRLVFRHQIQAGPAQASYGIAVAQLAGIPQPVIARAQAHLTRLRASVAQTSETVTE